MGISLIKINTVIKHISDNNLMLIKKTNNDTSNSSTTAFTKTKISSSNKKKRLIRCSHTQLRFFSLSLPRFDVVCTVNKLCYRRSSASFFFLLNILRHIQTYIYTYIHSIPSFSLLHPVRSLINFVCIVDYSLLFFLICT